MKHHVYTILLAGCLFVAMPAFAGNIYLTGHDLDFHCALQPAPTQCNAFKIAVALARAGAPDPTKPVLFVDQPNTCVECGGHNGQQQTALAAANVGLAPGTDYVVVDPTTSAWTGASLGTNTYSAILFASYINCGGCDNTDAAVTAINARSAAISAFFNSRGGLVYLAGALNSSYYATVPIPITQVSTVPGSPSTTCLAETPTGTCYTLTSAGTKLGLTNTDANCCATHNSFTPPPANSALTVAELDGASTPNAETMFATSTQAQVLTFSPGANSSAIATFNCTSGLIPCPDADAHSMKFTVGNVSSSFSVVLTATEVDGNGVCLSGVPGDPSDPIDCRFVRFFGQPTYNGTPFPPTKVPHCYPYSHNHCVVYGLEGAPPPPGQAGSPYSNGVQYKIAWNNVFSPPTGWVNSPRMYDDPGDDHDSVDYPTISDPINPFPYSTGQPEDNQFVFDVTTFFDPRPNTVGTDPTTGGTGRTFNDWAIAWPLTIGSSVAQIQQPINPDGSSVFSATRGVIPVKFTLLVDGAATCNLPQATISLTRLSGGTVGAIDESLFTMAADSGPNFRISGCQYIYNLAASSLGPGTYLVSISINSKVVGNAFFALK